MAELHIVTSNRMEVLIESLAEVVREPLLPAMAPEIVLVQSRGMERWVSMELARLNGVCANMRFPFPNAFLEEFLCRAAPGGASPPADRDAQTFRLMRMLPAYLGRAEFESLNAYLREDPTRQKLFQLCQRLADLFDQYAVFRPDMLSDWEQGRVAADAAHLWQARLWNDLVAQSPDVNPVRRLDACGKAMEGVLQPAGGLPQRVSVFGISYLPPVYLKSLHALARTVRVHLFLLNPCREYWADIVSESEIRRLERRRSPGTGLEAALHLERGNRLLASLGALGRDFFEMIAELGGEGDERFVEPPADTLLSRIQADILDLRDPEALPADRRVGPAAADGSIQIHSCHGPMREIEVLHDRLLSFFEEDPDLLPKDVVVMAPDIGAFAPYISAVFGSQSDPRLRIPYSIADRGSAGENSLQSALFALLDLKESRFGAAAMMGLLEFPVIQAAFGFTESQLPLIERWVRQSGIRWGEDGAGRAELGLPADPHHTWKAGMERLLLGYAMPSRERHLFRQILAYDALEGAETRVLGNLAEFMEQVFALARTLPVPKPLAQWSRTLQTALAAFVRAEDGLESDAQRLESLLAELAGFEATAGYHEPVGLEVVRSFLSARLETARLGFGFLSGGVTFCAALPMRSIPFQVICLIGMNHDAFPREHHPPIFDLAARKPRAGDRSRRNDDKYLFLEAILSARRTLYISYAGQDIQDNSPQPPSVLVSELIDTLQKGYGLPEGASPGGAVTEHRLQAFSRDYFRGEDSGLFSYSQEDRQACAAAGARRTPAALFRAPLPLSAEEAARFRALSLEDLLAFFLHPARFLVQRRLGIRLEDGTGAPEEREPFDLDALTRYRLGQEMLTALARGEDLSHLYATAAAAGELPHGRVGEYRFGQLQAEVGVFFKKARRMLPEDAGESRELDLSLNGFRLTGRLTGVCARGLLQLRFANVAAKDFITAWLRHLCLCAVENGSAGRESLLVGKDATWSFTTVAEPAAVLEALLAIYWKGLIAPLRFFPRSSLAFFRKRQVLRGDDRQALAEARRQWVGNEFAPGEAEDRYYQLCGDPAAALDEEFQRVAVQFFEPVFTHATRLS